MQRKRLRTIADLADLAGVSKATVSRALNDSPLIGLDTKERIVTLAKEYGFQPSAVGRNLSLRTSRTIGFVTHAFSDSCCAVTDPFSLEIMGGVAKGLHELGYDMLVLHVDPRRTDWADQYLDSGKVDGFILMTSNKKHKHIEHLLELQAPFVAWGFGEGFCRVCGEDRKGGRLAAERFLALGRKRIGFIGGPRIETEVQERHRGFAEALAALGQAPGFDRRLVVYGDYSEVSGASALRELLAREASLDAVFACSDLMAIAAIRELKALGRRVPEDVAVIGYDDLQVASYVSPALSTISQGIGNAGMILARDLVAAIATKIITTSILPVELKLRESA